MCRVPFSFFVFVGFEKNEKKKRLSRNLAVYFNLERSEP